jgi:metallo-beta-lactamase class B
MMKKLVTTILSLLIYYGLNAQAGYKTIKISKDIELIKLSENAYVHVSYASLPVYGRFDSNGLIFINNHDAFLFDTPMTDSLTKILVAYLQDSMNLKITGFVPNHWHDDCIGGLGYLKSLKIESYANQMTIDIAKKENLPLPDHGFSDSLQLKLGDKMIKCYYPGPAHTLDNIVVWIPSEKILFAGCMVRSLDSKSLGHTSDGDLKAYPITIEKLLHKFQNAKIVIPGHGSFGGFDLIKHTLELATK